MSKLTKEQIEEVKEGIGYLEAFAILTVRIRNEIEGDKDVDLEIAFVEDDVTYSFTAKSKEKEEE